MKLKIIICSVVLMLLTTKHVCCQQITSDAYNKKTYTYDGMSFTVYKFSRSKFNGKRIMAKYFARNAYDRFETWRLNKNVLIACSGAFSVSWDVNSTPYGLCIDNGYVVNKNLAVHQDKNGNSLDGLVIVYGGGEGAGGIAIKDIEHGEICTQTPSECYDVKNSSYEKIKFINWAKENNATVFQLPIMYSNEYGKNYGRINYGDRKERRFLALCKSKNGILYHFIIDVKESVYMNASSQKIEQFLKDRYQVIYGLLILDTGGKNILNEFNGKQIRKIGETDIEKATNLLVYYYE